MTNVLFVCSGNIFRSVSAKRLLEVALANQDIQAFSLQSAGVTARPQQMRASQQAALDAHGASTKPHVQTKLSQKEIDWADIIIAMGVNHQEHIKHTYHTHAYLFNELVANKSTGVLDVEEVLSKNQRSQEHIDAHVKHTINYLAQQTPTLLKKLHELRCKLSSSNQPLKAVSTDNTDMVRVAINGFGRIGRMVFRAGLNNTNIEFVALNDLTDTKTLAYLLKHDSVHNTLDAEVGYDNEHIYVDGKAIRVYAQREPEHIPWGDHHVDVVVESTGFFRTEELAKKHLTAGAKKVLISAPAKGGDVQTIVKGINEHTLSEESCVISNASCTTNCLGLLVKVLHDNFGIETGFFNTIHSYTGDQKHVDGPHKDLRRGRAAAVNIVPTTSGAAIAVEQAIPELTGRITGMATRVPTPDGSLTDFTCTLQQDTSVQEINNLFANVAQHHLSGVLEYSQEELVSTDIIGNPHSCIFDAGQTQVLNGRQVRVLGWYDNEWGYSNRIVDILQTL